MMFAYLTHGRIQLFDDPELRLACESETYSDLNELEETIQQFSNQYGRLDIYLSGSFAFTNSIQMDKQSSRRGQTVAYALEEFLPLPAEEFLVYRFRKSDLYVTRFDREFNELLQRVGESGACAVVGFRAVCVIQKMQTERNATAGRSIALCDNDDFDLFSFDDGGKIQSWNWFPDSASLFQHIDQVVAPDSLDVVVDNDSVADELTKSLGVAPRQLPFNQLADETGQRILRGRSQPILQPVANGGEWSGEYSTQIQWLVFALAVAMIGFGVSFLKQAEELKRSSVEVRQSIEQNIKDLMPGFQPGPLIVRQLGSIKDNDQSLREKVTELGKPADLKLLFQTVFSSMPSSSDFSISRLKLERQSIAIDGIHFYPERFAQFQNKLVASGFRLDESARFERNVGNRRFRFRYQPALEAKP